MVSYFLQLIQYKNSLSDPRLVVYSSGAYLLGVVWGAGQLKNSIVNIPPSAFMAYLVVCIAMGIVMGISHARGSSRLFSPAELLVCFLSRLGRKEIFKKHPDINTTLSILLSGASLVLFFSITALFFNSNIFLLGIVILGIDFIYNSRYIRGRYRPYLDSLSGAAYVIPLLMGYTFSAGVWPDIWFIFAGILYCSSIELYAIAVHSGEQNACKGVSSVTIFGKRGALCVSIFFVILSGGIAVMYQPLYFLIVVPFLSVLLISLFLINKNYLHEIYRKSFLVHSMWGFFVTWYLLSFILT